MHILCVTGVNDNDGVAFNYIGVVPFIGVRHVVTRPSADGRFPTWQGSFNSIDIEDGVTDVTLHVFKRVGVTILQRNIPVERFDISKCTFYIYIYTASFNS